jgi:hypothetical protein
MGRFLGLVLTLCVSIFLLLSASGVLFDILPASDVRRLGRAVEIETLYRQSHAAQTGTGNANVWIDPHVLAEVTRSPSMQLAEDRCLDDASRAALAIRLGALDQAVLSEASDREIRNLVAAAYRAVGQRLRCAPTDGNAWMLRAQLWAQQGGDAATFGRLLDLSYFYAPAEKWIMIPRLQLVGDLIERGYVSAPPQYGLDLERVIGLSEPQVVADLYVAGGDTSRQLMRTVIDKQRLDRRVRILRLIDALGVFYPVASACRSPAANGPPGSELEWRHPADLVAACAK